MTRNEFMSSADRIIARLEAVVAMPALDRDEPVPESLLLTALRLVKGMRDSVGAGTLLPRSRRGRPLTRTFADCFDHHAWPNTGTLINDIEELEDEYTKL